MPIVGISAAAERDATSRSVGAFGRKTGQGLAQLARDLVAQIKKSELQTECGKIVGIRLPTNDDGSCAPMPHVLRCDL